MDDHTDEKMEGQDTMKDNEIENLDESTMQKIETLASKNANEFKEVQSDDEKTSEDQEIGRIEEKQYSTESMNIKNFPTVVQTEKKICTEMEIINKEKNQDIETKITEKMETGTEADDVSNKSIQQSMVDMKKEIAETAGTADSTTDANTIIIDLCDDDQVDIYEQIGRNKIVARYINLKSNTECKASNKATPEQMEDNNEKKPENVTTSDSNKQIRDTIIIDLCGDDQTEFYEKNIGCFLQGDGEGTLSHKEGGNISRAIPCSVVIKPKESKGKTEPTHICDDRGTEIETSSRTENKQDELQACEMANENVYEEGRPLTCVEEFKVFQMTEKDVSESRCKTTMKSHSKEVDPDDSNITKDDNITENEGDRACLETETVYIEEKCEASTIKDNSDEIEIKTKNEEYQIETFRFKDDIITLQEDYGMDSKQTGNDSSYNLEESNVVSEDAKYTILDESDSDEKRCDSSDLILGCGPEDMTETNTKIRDISQSVTKITGIKLKTIDNESRENIEHEPGLKPGKNEKEEIQLILIKKEIEDNLKHFDGIEIKEHIPSKVEKAETNQIHSKITEEPDQSEYNLNNIQVSSNSGSFDTPTPVMEGRLTENSNQLTVIVEKSTGTSNGGEVESSSNVQLIINLDIVKSEENEDIITLEPNVMGNGCSIKESDSKVCQTDSGSSPNKNLTSAYLNDTPPSRKFSKLLYLFLKVN